MRSDRVWYYLPAWTGLPDATSYLTTLFGGISSFFRPNAAAFLGPHVPRRRTCGVLSHGAVTQDCQRTGRLRAHEPQFIANDRRRVRGAQRRHAVFRHARSSDDHRSLLASSALPPAFPAVRIDGELYWDGGILSNSPTEVIFEDNARHTSLIFSVHVWNRRVEPETIWEVIHRQKDIQYSSRIAGRIAP